MPILKENLVEKEATVRSSISRVLLLASLPLLLLHASCASNGDIKETKPLKSSLTEFRHLAIIVSAATPEAKKYVATLKIMLANQIKKNKLFAQVDFAEDNPRGADLGLKVNIVGMSEGNKAARMFNMGGEAEFTLQAELVQIRGKRSLASLDVSGNSLRTSQTTIGGVSTDMGGAFDDLTKKAMTAACERVTEYLKKHIK